MKESDSKGKKVCLLAKRGICRSKRNSELTLNRFESLVSWKKCDSNRIRNMEVGIK